MYIYILRQYPRFYRQNFFWVYFLIRSNEYFCDQFGTYRKTDFYTPHKTNSKVYFYLLERSMNTVRTYLLRNKRSKCKQRSKWHKRLFKERDFAADVYLSEAQNPIPPPPPKHYTCIQNLKTVTPGGGGGGVEPERGQQVTKLGWKHQHDW
jgi:hypothetical protein